MSNIKMRDDDLIMRDDESLDEFMERYEDYQAEYNATRNRFWLRVSVIVSCLMLFFCQWLIVIMALEHTITNTAATLTILLLVAGQYHLVVSSFVSEN